ncbi:MAG: serine hydrolase domain-containing protein [Gammaproteobacteria bacterium]|nr:serine hydrolase domain-containing protein [Gammaproteobacteria bacterium]
MRTHILFFHAVVLLVVLLVPISSFAKSLLFGAGVRHFPPGASSTLIPASSGVRSDQLQNISRVIQSSIAASYYPGAVVLVYHHHRKIYQGIFGNQQILPSIVPMRLTVIFDLASLTKVIATTTAIMQLVEQGRLELDAPVAEYWPAFATHGKANITIRELLTHTSGLQADVSNSENNILQKVVQLTPQYTPGTRYLYSDLGFIVLGELVRIISGEPLDVYATKNIFMPLGMHNTFFNPPLRLQKRIAPTDLEDGKLYWGTVQDPLARAMGGVSGHAGLFSTATDLARFTQMMLSDGKISFASKKSSSWILSPLTILKMTTSQTPSSVTEAHGLGWDIDSRFSSRGILLPTQSYGHTGWTGTSIWLDPATQTAIIFLTSRTHPKPDLNNQVVEDRRLIANIVAASLTDVHSVSTYHNTFSGELQRAYATQ